MMGTVGGPRSECQMGRAIIGSGSGRRGPSASVLCMVCWGMLLLSVSASIGPDNSLLQEKFLFLGPS